jgi:hypothetical protein
VAQALGHVRLVVTILTENYKPHFNVFSQSLGQVACSHLLGRNYFVFIDFTFFLI